MRGRTHRAALDAALVVALVGALLTSFAPAVALEPPPAPAVAELPADWPAPPSIEATSFVLVDAATGQVLAASDEQVRRPVASTIKVLTALSVVERASLETAVTVGDEVTGIGGASVGLTAGETWTVDELLEAIIARSGNEAAHALAVHAAGTVEDFVAAMEADLRTLGVDGVAITDVSGLEDRNLLSALDLATIARAALADPQLRPILGEPIVSLPGLGAVESRNLLLRSYPDATGVKTGYTAAAGYCLVASARRDGRELIAVVLDAGDDPARFEQAAALLDHGFRSYETAELDASLHLSTAGGGVDLDIAPVVVNVPAGATAGLDLPLQARPPDAAPVVDVLVDGHEVGSVSSTLQRRGTAVPEGGPAALGAGLVDGAYAALRAGAATGSLR